MKLMFLMAVWIGEIRRAKIMTNKIRVLVLKLVFSLKTSTAPIKMTMQSAVMANISATEPESSMRRRDLLVTLLKFSPMRWNFSLK